jgi:hypothetical protein
MNISSRQDRIGEGSASHSSRHCATPLSQRHPHPVDTQSLGHGPRHSVPLTWPLVEEPPPAPDSRPIRTSQHVFVETSSSNTSAGRARDGEMKISSEQHPHRVGTCSAPHSPRHSVAPRLTPRGKEYISPTPCPRRLPPVRGAQGCPPDGLGPQIGVGVLAPWIDIGGMCISLKVPRSWPGVLGIAAVARLRRVRVASTDNGRRRRRHRLRSLGVTSSCSRSADGRVFAKTIRITDRALPAGEFYMSAISSWRRSHRAGRTPTSRRREDLSVVVARFGRPTVGRCDLSLPSSTAMRECVARKASVRRLGRGGRRRFRQGSARASACASLRATACASCWPLRPEPERPCSSAAFGAFGSGDIFFYVVPRGCWL